MANFFNIHSYKHLNSAREKSGKSALTGWNDILEHRRKSRVLHSFLDSGVFKSIKQI